MPPPSARASRAKEATTSESSSEDELPVRGNRFDMFHVLDDEEADTSEAVTKGMKHLDVKVKGTEEAGVEGQSSMGQAKKKVTKKKKPKKSSGSANPVDDMNDEELMDLMAQQNRNNTAPTIGLSSDSKGKRQKSLLSNTLLSIDPKYLNYRNELARTIGRENVTADNKSRGGHSSITQFQNLFVAPPENFPEPLLTKKFFEDCTFPDSTQCSVVA